MSCKVWESTSLSCPAGDLWRRLRELDFAAFLPGLVSGASSSAATPSTVGSVYTLKFVDGATWDVKVLEISELQMRLTWEVVKCEPAIQAASRVDTLHLRRVTADNSTFLVWDTDFSGDASLAVTQDCKFKVRTPSPHPAILSPFCIPQHAIASASSRHPHPRPNRRSTKSSAPSSQPLCPLSVSYTHLTLPTKA